MICPRLSRWRPFLVAAVWATSAYQPPPAVADNSKGDDSPDGLQAPRNGGLAAPIRPAMSVDPRASATAAGTAVPAASLARDMSGGRDTPVDVLCQAAVNLALADPARARGLVTRARLAGWLPEVSFRVYRRFARTEGLSFDDTGVGTVSPVDISAIDDVRYEWRATWDLSRIVFNPDELQAHHEALRTSDVRRDIQFLVIRLYFERRRLMMDAPSSPAPSGDSAERRFLRIAEIEAQLDAVSDGALSHGTSARGQVAGSP